jgi:amidase
MPVLPCAPILHDHFLPIASGSARIADEQRPYFNLLTWMAPAGACYLPTTVVPIGSLRKGLPVGIQVLGPYLEDRTTLDLAKRLLALLGGCPRPTGF